MHFNYKRVCWFIIMTCWFFPHLLSGQVRTVKKTERKKELIKKLEKKYYLKAHKKIIKHRKNMQTDDTKKRMNEADKRARNFNRGNHLSWIERQFIRKKPKR